METLLIGRERFLKFIARQGNVVQFIGRFVGGFLLFYVTTQLFGYNRLVSQPFVAVTLGLICVFVPSTIVFLLYNLVVVLQIATTSVELSIAYLIVIILYYLIYQRMVPRAGLLFMMTPVFFYFHMPAVLPLLVGSFVGISGLPAILMGSFGYYLANIVADAVSQIDTGATTTHMYSLVLQETSGNMELLLVIIAFVLVVAVVAALRKIYVAYGWYIAIFTGGVLYVLTTLIGGYFFGYEMSVVGQFITAACSVVIVMLMQLFYNVVDYTKEENLEFEDEEYYYYVKAIPKISVEEEEFQVTKITMPGRRFHVKKKESDGEEE